MSDNAKAHSPVTLEEAYAALAERGAAIKVIAGGTDVMVLLNARALEAPEFLDIWRIDEMRGITDEGSAIRIGALTTFTQLIRSPIIREHVPALALASRTVGAIQIQNRGTIGGNIVNASPAGDSLPVLAAYASHIEIGSARGVRRIEYDKFHTGYCSTALAPDELVLAVLMPKLTGEEQDFFWKVGTRRAQSISKTVMAARAKISNGLIESMAIGVGSVAPTVVRARQTESLLTGARLAPDIIEEARLGIAREIEPITDLRSTEHYRRTVTGNVLAKFLRHLMRS
jgi:CO/xanthine dehydrogenase FAD-binding subunit